MPVSISSGRIHGLLKCIAQFGFFVLWLLRTHIRGSILCLLALRLWDSTPGLLCGFFRASFRSRTSGRGLGELFFLTPLRFNLLLVCIVGLHRARRFHRRRCSHNGLTVKLLLRLIRLLLRLLQWLCASCHLGWRCGHCRCAHRTLDGERETRLGLVAFALYLHGQNDSCPIDQRCGGALLQQHQLRIRSLNACTVRRHVPDGQLRRAIPVFSFLQYQLDMLIGDTPESHNHIVLGPTADADRTSGLKVEVVDGFFSLFRFESAYVQREGHILVNLCHVVW
mmetsp:Transcript_48001/g.126637  ORF Transcript_48001/g.126637 Transcript_48001/m.126637 type:complete len:281 (+) Transcript_48001:3807-4649(+)